MTDITRLVLEADSRPIRTADSDLDRLAQTGKRTENSVGRVNSGFTSMTRIVRQLSPMLMGLGAALSFRQAGRNIIDYQQSMAEVAAITRASSDEMERISVVAREMGATTEFTAAQAASGFKFLGMAGFDAEKSIAALPDVLNLSTAAALDLGVAADIVSNIMSGFGLAAEESALAADVIAAVSSRANTSVNQMGEAMKHVAPVASSLGISINDTAAAIGTLSDAGIQGGMAGTSLRRIMSRLVKPTGDAQKAIFDLGLSLEDVNPKFHSIAEIINTFTKAGIDSEEAFRIFGDRGGPAMLALVENNSKLSELTEGLQDVSGEAERMAEVMRDTLGRDIDTLFSSIMELTLVIGDRLMPFMRGTVQAMTAVVRASEHLIGPLSVIAQWLGVIIAIKFVWWLGAVAAAKAVAITQAVLYQIALIKMAGGITAATAALSGMQKTLLVVTAAFAGWKLGEWARKEFEWVEKAGIALAAGLTKMVARAVGVFEIFKEKVKFALTNPFAYARNRIIDFFEFLQGLGAGALRALGMDGFADALGKDLNHLRTTTEKEHKASLERIRENTRQELLQIDDIYSDMFAQVGKNAEIAEEGTEKVTESVKDMGEALERVRSSVWENKDEFEQLSDRLDPVSAEMKRIRDETLLLTEALAVGEIGLERFNFLLAELEKTKQENIDQEKMNEQAQRIIESLWTEEQEIAASYARRREIILAAEFETEEARTEILEQLTKERNDRINEIEKERISSVLKMNEEFFGGLAGLAKSFAGEHSGIYRGIFAVEKAFSIARALMNIPESYSEAYKAVVGIPIVGPAMAPVAGATAAAAQVAQASAIRNISPSFEGGGYTGNRPRSGGLDGKGGFGAILHGKETVIDHTKSGGPNLGTNVIIHNYSGERVKKKEDKDGNVELIIGKIKGELSSDVRRGVGFAKDLQETYNLRREGFS